MTRQVYFVVGVDIDTKEVFVDDDVFTARFGKDEGTWNTDTFEWNRSDWDTEFTPAQEILNGKLFPDGK